MNTLRIRSENMPVHVKFIFSSWKILSSLKEYSLILTSFYDLDQKILTEKKLSFRVLVDTNCKFSSYCHKGISALVV